MRPERRNSRKGSVLVVDDEEIMREVLETLLTNEGYRVDLAKTGEEGLEAYGRRAYDVVLLDVSMPGIGGLRALEEFLKMDSDAVIVMIRLTPLSTPPSPPGNAVPLAASESRFKTNRSPPLSPRESSDVAKRKNGARCVAR